jgi:glyoxylase-like metal-dependent hydrolase (beta-lactamase superfamily II)
MRPISSFHALPILVAILLVAGLGCYGSDSEIREQRLNPRVLILQHGPWLENMIAIDAGSEVIVIDTLSTPQAAAEAKAIIDSRFHKPVRVVINTHHHWDHSFGNQAFRGATIIAHRWCAEDMAAEYSTPEQRRARLMPRPGSDEPDSLLRYYREVRADIDSGFRLTIPNKLVGNHESIRAGNLTIHLYHAPGLHTRSFLIIHVPDLGLVLTRRVFMKDALPVLETGADLHKLITCLRQILSDSHPLQFFVAGHGDALPNPDLSTSLAYFQALQRAVATKRSSDPRGCPDNDFSSFPQVAKFPEVHSRNLEIIRKSVKIESWRSSADTRRQY